MKTIQTTALILLFTTVFFCCSKEDETTTTPTVEDCKQKNYGLLTVNYSNLSANHAIDVTVVSDSPVLNTRTKTSNTGVATDTLHLKPGIYRISISRINANGQSLEDHPVVTSDISQCSTQIINTQI
jgi:hypothetical protein